MLNTLVIPYWKKILRKNFTNWEKLSDYLELSEHQREQIYTNPKFILNLPFRLAEKIKKGTLDDPILKQFLPLKLEKNITPGFVSDPVGDSACRRGSKLLHKYNARVLIVATSACAMDCRYCFRQKFDYEVKDKTFNNELEMVAQDSSITEVILSGGDPLSLSNEILTSLLFRICEIDHVKRIRFHTRFPIGIPERIDEGFLNLISGLNKKIWFVIHCNHANELDSDVLSSIYKLQKRGVMVLNQSVLLKGINDSVDVLRKLCDTLIDNNIIPYYLHQLDRVQGAGHFEVDIEKGLELIRELAAYLPGYGVPKYVKEVAGKRSKTPVVDL